MNQKVAGMPLGYWLALGIVGGLIWRSRVLERLSGIWAPKDTTLPGKVQGTTRANNTISVVEGVKRTPFWAHITGPPAAGDPAPAYRVTRQGRQ